MAKRKRRPKVAGDVEPLVKAGTNTTTELVFNSPDHESWLTFRSDPQDGMVTVDSSDMSGRPRLDGLCWHPAGRLFTGANHMAYNGNQLAGHGRGSRRVTSSERRLEVSLQKGWEGMIPQRICLVCGRLLQFSPPSFRGPYMMCWECYCKHRAERRQCDDPFKREK